MRLIIHFLCTLVLATHMAASAVLRQRAASSAVSQILLIAPGATSCQGAPFPDECRTAEQAAPFLIDAMITYKIFAPGQIAALLSLMAFETADFKYNKNHFPGRPGQGTRNMQMPQFNLQYARSVPELAPKTNAITNGAGTDSLTTTQLDSLLDLVLPDQYSFAAAAWFLTSQCSASTLAGLESGSDDAYSAYLGCVGTSATAERMAYWQRAKSAFGIS